MKAHIRHLDVGHRIMHFIVIDKTPLPGEYTVGTDNSWVQVNQSTCNWCSQTAIQHIESYYGFKDGQEVDIAFKCKAENNCQYPFCGEGCPGSGEAYILGVEDRGY